MQSSDCKRQEQGYIYMSFCNFHSGFMPVGQARMWIIKILNCPKMSDCLSNWEGHGQSSVTLKRPRQASPFLGIDIFLVTIIVGQMVMSSISSAYLPYFMHCPEVRVSHRRSCALTDIHRDITGGSQGHYQARILTVSLHNLPIPWSPLSVGSAFFALIYQFLDISVWPSTIC